MGFVSRIKGWFADQPQNSVEFSPEWYEMVALQASSTGIHVDWAKALQVTTAQRCSALIAEGICSVPFKIYQTTKDDDKAEARDNLLWDLVHSAPNSLQTSYEFRETIGIHLALCNNAYVLLNKVRGRIFEMLPLQPGWVTVIRNLDWTMKYIVRMPDGTSYEYGPDEIWHIKRKSWDSKLGHDAMRMAREAIGLSLAMEEGQGTVYKHGMRPSGVLSVEKPLSEEDFKRYRALVDFQYAGRANQGKPVILDSGAKWTPTAINAADAQLLDLRNHQIEEVARTFGILPIMVGHSGDKGTTYASAEQMFIAHFRHTIRPLHRMFEQSADKSLLSPVDRKNGLYFGFVDAELIRGDMKAMAEFYSMALGGGKAPAWMSQNEVRVREELPKVAGCDRLWAPINTAPIGDDGLPMLPAKAAVPPPVALASGNPRERIGGNGGPLLDDDRQNIGRVLSSQNEKLIRAAGGAITDADGKLKEVLAKLDAEEPEEPEEPAEAE